MRDIRRNVAWEADGVESSVAIMHSWGQSFSVNGKKAATAKAGDAVNLRAHIDVPPGAASRPQLRVSLYERPVASAAEGGAQPARDEEREELAR